jgi:predicted RNase H-like nuclease (RuvC/YqgF family)
MSKEIETIDTYIGQQTSQISELMQTVILLQTKVKMLELENKKLESKNKKLVSENKNTKGINRVDLRVDLERTIETPVERNLRTSLTNSKRTTEEPIERNLRTSLTSSKRNMDLVQEKTVINGGFTTRKETPEE